MLTQRQKNILRIITRRFIDTASPVASDHLVKQCGLKLSSATVRNEMTVLESEGYLSQPYTSAGRIPTDKGYRFYVNSLMRMQKIPNAATEKIQQQLMQHRGNVKLMLAEASRIISHISNELSVVLTPWMSKWVFDRLELIELSRQKVLVVIHVRSRMAKSVVLEVESRLNHATLKATEELLNERLSGLTLFEIKSTIKERFQDVNRGDLPFIKKMVHYAPDLFNLNEALDVHTAGTHHIVAQPEFSDKSLLENLFSVVENQQALVRLFEKQPRQTNVFIGSENPDKRLQALTVVHASYHMGESTGTLGIIGPTRMPYDHVVPLVSFMAQTMSCFLS